MEPGPEAIRSIAHDLRNLLTAVRGHADLALRGLSAEDPAREDVAHVVVVTAAVFELVDQLDGADASDTHVAVSLDTSVGAMRRLLDALLPTDIELHLAPDSGQIYVTISKLRIERIVLNLALNARDAMASGGTLSITTEPGTDDMAHIVVADTGPGFSEAALEHLFEVGFTTKHASGGSGNGLSAVARFVDSAGGSVEVDSVEGEGATITVALPMAEVEAFDLSARIGAPRAQRAVTGEPAVVASDVDESHEASGDEASTDDEASDDEETTPDEPTAHDAPDDEVSESGAAEPSTEATPSPSA